MLPIYRSVFVVLRHTCKVLEAYKATEPGTIAHQLRLLEVIADALRFLGACVFASAHPTILNIATDSDEEDEDEEETQEHFFWRDFSHHAFGYTYEVSLSHVGHWTESQVFGGVIGFERGGDTDQEVCIIKGLSLTPNMADKDLSFYRLKPHI